MELTPSRVLQCSRRRLCCLSRGWSDLSHLSNENASAPEPLLSFGVVEAVAEAHFSPSSKARAMQGAMGGRVTVIVVVVVVIAAAATAFFVMYKPWTPSEEAIELEVIYNEQFVLATLSGKVFNYADRNRYGTLKIVLTDDRGYSRFDTIYMGKIGANGGFYIVLKVYDWPAYYGGWGSSESDVLPITVDASVSWRSV